MTGGKAEGKRTLDDRSPELASAAEARVPGRKPSRWDIRSLWTPQAEPASPEAHAMDADDTPDRADAADVTDVADSEDEQPEEEGGPISFKQMAKLLKMQLKMQSKELNKQIDRQLET